MPRANGYSAKNCEQIAYYYVYKHNHIFIYTHVRVQYMYLRLSYWLYVGQYGHLMVFTVQMQQAAHVCVVCTNYVYRVFRRVRPRRYPPTLCIINR